LPPIIRSYHYWKKIMKINHVPLLSLLLTLISLSGCSGLDQVGQIVEQQLPKTSVEGVRITALDFDGVDLAFDVGVANPNPVAISLAGLDYDLQLEGSSFMQGDQPLGLMVVANGKSQVEVPLRLGFQQLFNSYHQLKERNEAGYDLLLGLSFDLPVLGRVRLPVKYSGRLPVPKIPQVEVRSIKLQQLSMSGADLQLELDVDNPNAFSLLLNRLNYNLELNGHQVSDGLMSKAVQVEEGGKTSIKLPLSLNFLQLGAGLYSALSQDRPLSYKLTGELDATSSNALIGAFRLPVTSSGTVGVDR
jgi:LEA14-like dessication related protein